MVFDVLACTSPLLFLAFFLRWFVVGFCTSAIMRVRPTLCSTAGAWVGSGDSRQNSPAPLAEARTLLRAARPDASTRNAIAYKKGAVTSSSRCGNPLAVTVRFKADNGGPSAYPNDGNRAGRSAGSVWRI